MKNEITPYANSVFEQPWWLDIVAHESWNEVFVKENNEIIARLPYVLKRGNICMPRLTQTLGPWIKPEYRNILPGNTQFKIQKEIIVELFSQLPDHKNFKMTFDSVNNYILPLRWLGYRYTPSFSYRIFNLENFEDISSNFSRTVIKNVRRARRKISIHNEPDVDILLKLMELTFKHQNRKYPISSELVCKLVEGCINNNAGRMFTAIDEDGQIHACSFMVYDEKCAYALLGGTDPQYRNSGAKSVIWNDEIEFASGVSKMFDFEGSNIETIENFVRQFGGTPVINYEVIQQSLLSEFIEMAKPRIKKFLGYKL